LPKNLPNLKNIKIQNYKTSKLLNIRTSSKYHIQSFKDLPEKLQSLENISIINSNITNFEELTAQIPKLKRIGFSKCYIHDFRGIPKKNLSIDQSTIESFEGIELFIPHRNQDRQILLSDCTIRSFGGVSRSTIQALLIAILCMEYHESPEKINLDLPKTGIELLKQSINPEIERIYCPKYYPQWPYVGKYRNYLDEWQLTHDGYEENIENASVIQWIYGFHLTEKLFISEKLDHLHEYYKKTTRQLTQDYISEPKSLPPDQIERLVHEVDPEIRKMLENDLPPSDSLVKQISSKFTFSTENGLTILK